MSVTVPNAEGWAIDIYAAFEALDVEPTSEHICGVLAVVEQGSNYQVDPAVPNLPAIARRKIASRNAAFQNAVNIASGKRVALDGDLLIERSSDPSATELAIRSIGGRLDLSDAQIRSALEQGGGAEFERTLLYSRMMVLADALPPGRPVPRVLVPRIATQEPEDHPRPDHRLVRAPRR